MLQLYTGSGSSEIELLKQEPADWWERLKRNACCYLTEADKPDVACLLKSRSVYFEIRGEISELETFAVGSGIRELPRLRKLYGRGRWRKRKTSRGSNCRS